MTESAFQRSMPWNCFFAAQREFFFFNLPSVCYGNWTLVKKVVRFIFLGENDREEFVQSIASL